MKNGAGTLDRRFGFDRRLEQPDGAGNTVSSWKEAFQCATGFLPLRGTETVMAARLEGIQPVILRIRACRAAAEVTSDWRARDLRLGTVYNLQAPVLTDDRHYYEIMATSGTAHG